MHPIFRFFLVSFFIALICLACTGTGVPASSNSLSDDPSQWEAGLIQGLLAKQQSYQVAFEDLLFCGYIPEDRYFKLADRDLQAEWDVRIQEIRDVAASDPTSAKWPSVEFASHSLEATSTAHAIQYATGTPELDAETADSNAAIRFAEIKDAKVQALKQSALAFVRDHVAETEELHDRVNRMWNAAGCGR